MENEKGNPCRLPSHLPVEGLPGVVREASVVPAFDHYGLRVFWQLVRRLLHGLPQL